MVPQRNQPIVQQRNKRWIWIGGLIFTVLLVVVGVLGVKSYLKSKEREAIVQQIDTLVSAVEARNWDAIKPLLVPEMAREIQKAQDSGDISMMEDLIDQEMGKLPTGANAQITYKDLQFLEMDGTHARVSANVQMEGNGVFSGTKMQMELIKMDKQ